MTGVKNVKAASITATASFRLGVVGAMATELFAAKLEALDLKPKHVGLMIVLDAGLAAVQLDVAKVMGVAPSLVVTFADHLEELGAIQRVRDPADRRRQILSLTEAGRALLVKCATVAKAVDAELVGELSDAESAALTALMERLAAQRGLPTGR